MSLTRAIFLGLCLAFACCTQAQTRFTIDLEGGLAFSGYNRIQIPGNTGTRFNAREALDQKAQPYYRIRPSLVLGRHVISGLFAPLKLKYTGTFAEPVLFDGTTFGGDRPVTLRYKFNSYRLTYRYNFISSDRATVGLGLTGKVRDAYIELENGQERKRNSNVGVVPLINFYASAWLGEQFGLLLEGDALVSSRGRAEDVFGGVLYRPFENTAFKLGYRILEGGANNERVYNFNLVNYLAAGAIISL